MYLDKNIQQWYRLKAMSLEDFAAQSRLPDAAEVYNALQKAVPGYIKITKDGTGDVNYGFTPGFGEGVSCYMATPTQWYSTSVIQKINWEEKYFITLNSKYWFEFEPVEDAQVVEETKWEEKDENS